MFEYVDSVTAIEPITILAYIIRTFSIQIKQGFKPKIVWKKQKKKNVKNVENDKNYLTYILVSYKPIKITNETDKNTFIYIRQSTFFFIKKKKKNKKKN